MKKKLLNLLNISRKVFFKFVLFKKFLKLFLYKVYIRKCSRTSVNLKKWSCTFCSHTFQKILLRWDYKTYALFVDSYSKKDFLKISALFSLEIVDNEGPF